MAEITSFKGLCISAASGGGGKTLISLALGRILQRKQFLVKAFKKGPDYIDTAWLSLACGSPATNLDPYFLDSSQLLQLFYSSLAALNNANEGKELFALLEGNRGLYDGLDVRGSCSTANLARLLNLPVLLCLNCEKVTRTMSALIRGLTSFEDNINFCGLILNRVGSERHGKALRQAIEQDTDLKVLGLIPRLAQNPLPERHMGLAACGESLAENADAIIDRLGIIFAENCDLQALLACLPNNSLPKKDGKKSEAECIEKNANQDAKVRIGYVYDSAFWFYYPENLQALNDAGAELVPLKIINAKETDLHKWENLDGLYIGGGFPEDFAAELQASPLLKKIAGYAEKSMPIYAECGGLMLLCGSLELNGRKWRMSGIFNHSIEWHKKPQGLGYVHGLVVKENPFFPLGQTIKGHEFHYSSFIPANDGQEYALMLKRGSGLCKSEIPGCGAYDALIYKNVWASYTHIFAPALPCWAENFVKAAREWKNADFCGGQLL